MKCAGTIAISDFPYRLICALISKQSDQNTILTLMLFVKTDETSSNVSDLPSTAVHIVEQFEQRNIQIFQHNNT